MREKIISISLLFCIFLIGCNNIDNISEQQEVDDVQQLPYEGKKILFVDSYNDDFEWSQNIEDGVKNVLDESTGVELKVVHMDTKNNPEEEFKIEAAKKVKTVVEEFNPDVMIACDDNAFKYLVMEYYRDAELPITFCGVNWDLDAYDGPYNNTAGMVEIVLVNKAIEEVSQYAEGNKVGYLTFDSLSEYKNEENYKKIGINLVETSFVKTFEEWKTEFIKLQERNDIIAMGVTHGIKNFDPNEAEKFVLENVKKPIVTEHAYQIESNLGLISFSKSGQEQGEYSAQSALKIIDGTSPSEIGVTENKKGVIAINLKLADKLGISFSPDVIKNAELVVK